MFETEMMSRSARRRGEKEKKGGEKRHGLVEKTSVVFLFNRDCIALPTKQQDLKSETRFFTSNE